MNQRFNIGQKCITLNCDVEGGSKTFKAGFNSRLLRFPQLSMISNRKSCIAKDRQQKVNYKFINKILRSKARGSSMCEDNSHFKLLRDMIKSRICKKTKAGQFDDNEYDDCDDFPESQIQTKLNFFFLPYSESANKSFISPMSFDHKEDDDLLEEASGEFNLGWK